MSQCAIAAPMCIPSSLEPEPASTVSVTLFEAEKSRPRKLLVWSRSPITVAT
jgi:hypothetical protein